MKTTTNWASAVYKTDTHLWAHKSSGPKSSPLCDALSSAPPVPSVAAAALLVACYHTDMLIRIMGNWGKWEPLTEEGLGLGLSWRHKAVFNWLLLLHAPQIQFFYIFVMMHYEQCVWLQNARGRNGCVMGYNWIRLFCFCDFWNVLCVYEWIKNVCILLKLLQV